MAAKRSWMEHHRVLSDDSSFHMEDLPEFKKKKKKKLLFLDLSSPPNLVLVWLGAGQHWAVVGLQLPSHSHSLND